MSDPMKLSTEELLVEIERLAVLWLGTRHPDFLMHVAALRGRALGARTNDLELVSEVNVSTPRLRRAQSGLRPRWWVILISRVYASLRPPDGPPRCPAAAKQGSVG